MLLLTRLALDDHRALLEGDAGYAPVLRAFEGLLAEQLGLEAREEESAAAALVLEGKRLDAEHDRLLRGLHQLLEALETLSEGDRAEAIARVRGRLFPEGLRMSQRTYAEQAAEAHLAARRLDDADRAALRALPLPDGRTAHDTLDAWTATCAALEQVERRRLTADDAEAGDPLRHIDVRNRWIRAVRALESLVALSGAADHPLLDAVRVYEAKADRRAAARAASATPPAAPLTAVEA